MRALWTVLRKELTDAFRDRRMLLVAFVVMPLAVPAILGGTATLGARRHMEQVESTLRLPVIGAAEAPNLLAWLAQHNVEIVAAPDDPDAAVREQRHDVVLRIDARYGEDWRAGRPARVEVLFDGSRPVATGATVARLRGLLDAYSETVGTLRLVARGIHPAVAQPLQVGARDVAAPGARFDLTQQLLPYLLLLLAFIGGMQLAIDATAGERERQSLEPLLATPVSREAIISAKILATATFALLTIAMTLLAYRVSFALLPAELVQGSFTLGPGALFALFAVILPVVLLGATVLTALAAFARSYREAQGYLPLLIFLPMVPSLVLMVAPARTQAWVLAVPFLGQNQLILKVLRGEPVTPTEWLVSLGAGFGLVGLAWLLAARLYQREHLAASS